MRPMVAFAFNLLSTFSALEITFMIHVTALEPLEQEMKRLEPSAGSRARFRPFGVGNQPTNPTPPFSLIDEAEKSVEMSLRDIANSKQTGKMPKLIICDVSASVYTKHLTLGVASLLNASNLR